MKRKLLLFIMMATVAFGLIGCSNAKRISTEDATKMGFKVVNVADKNLVYDVNTQIIYYAFTDGTGQCSHGFMSPYYSENGKLCRFINGEIQEIEGK